MEQDEHAGSNIDSFGDTIENRRDGNRRVTARTFPLDGIEFMSETLVNRILTERGSGRDVLHAYGVELADGIVMKAKRDIILCAVAFRNPQILLLSGIGPSEELNRHGIKQVFDLPDVGRNLTDHLQIPMFWKLCHSEQGLSAGHPDFHGPDL